MNMLDIKEVIANHGEPVNCLVEDLVSDDVTLLFKDNSYVVIKSDGFLMTGVDHCLIQYGE